MPNGNYTIHPFTNQSLAIEIDGARPYDGANCRLYKNYNLPWQQWIIYQTIGNQFQIASAMEPRLIISFQDASAILTRAPDMIRVAIADEDHHEARVNALVKELLADETLEDALKNPLLNRPLPVRKAYEKCKKLMQTVVIYKIYELIS